MAWQLAVTQALRMEPSPTGRWVAIRDRSIMLQVRNIHCPAPEQAGHQHRRRIRHHPTSQPTNAGPHEARSLMPDLVVFVWEIQVPIRPLGRQHHHAYHAARAAVPLDGLAQRRLHKLHGIGLLHALLPVRVAEAVDVRRARAADRVRLLVQRAAERDAVYLASVAVIPASNDEAGSVAPCQLCAPMIVVSRHHPRGRVTLYSREPVLVRVAYLLEDRGCRLCGGLLAVGHGEQSELVLHDVRYGLRVCRRAGAAAPDCVVYLRKLVRHSVRNVGSGRCPRVGAYGTLDG